MTFLVGLLLAVPVWFVLMLCFGTLRGMYWRGREESVPMYGKGKLGVVGCITFVASVGIGYWLAGLLLG